MQSVGADRWTTTGASSFCTARDRASKPCRALQSIGMRRPQQEACGQHSRVRRRIRGALGRVDRSIRPRWSRAEPHSSVNAAIRQMTWSSRITSRARVDAEFSAAQPVMPCWRGLIAIAHAACRSNRRLSTSSDVWLADRVGAILIGRGRPRARTATRRGIHSFPDAPCHIAARS